MFNGPHPETGEELVVSTRRRRASRPHDLPARPPCSRPTTRPRRSRRSPRSYASRRAAREPSGVVANGSAAARRGRQGPKSKARHGHEGSHLARTDDVRVDDVPDRRSRSRPTRSSGSPRRPSAAPTCTSTRCSAPFIDEGDILGHEPMGIVEEVGAERHHLSRGDRVVIPFNISCGHCWMCEQRPALAVRDDAGPRARHGRGAVRLHEALRPGAGRAGRVPARARTAHFGPIKVPDGPPDDRFLFLSDVLPTAWQAVEYADVPDGGTRAVLGLGPIGEMAARIAQHRGAGRVIGVDLVPERLARGRGARRRDARPRRGTTTSPTACRELTDGRGPGLGHRRGRHGGARLARRPQFAQQARRPAARRGRASR